MVIRPYLFADSIGEEALSCAARTIRVKQRVHSMLVVFRSLSDG